MPRSGKTTVLKSLLSCSNKIILHEERFDLVPYKDDGCFKYNLWYARYCISRLKKLPDREKIHLFDRSIIDRVAFGWALASYGRFTPRELEEYLAALEPYTSRQDITFVYNLSPSTSLKNAKGDKKTITRDLRFLKYLNSAYNRLSKKYKNIYYLPTGSDVKELLNFVLKILEDRQILTSHNMGYTENSENFANRDLY